MNRKWFFRCTAWSNLNLLKNWIEDEEKLKIRRRKTYTTFCWFLLSLILYLFVARNCHNMQCNAYTHQLSWPHILNRGSTVSNILDAKWSASWNESCFCAFTSKRNLCSAPLTALNNFCQQFGSINQLVLIFYLLTPRSHSLVFLPPVLQVSLFLWKECERMGGNLVFSTDSFSQCNLLHSVHTIWSETGQI